MTSFHSALRAIRQPAAILGAAALLSLAACNSAPEAPASETAASEAGGLTVTNARLVLAPVSGNPAAVYFDLSYAGSGDVTLAGVTVEGAGMTMVHQTVEKDGAMAMMGADPIALTKGANVVFAPGGLHVMAMEPSADWSPGGTVNVTLTLSDGTTYSFPATVRAAGEAR